MNRGLSANLIEPTYSLKSSRTSSCSSEGETQGNINGYLIPTLVKSSKKVTICTLCGRYRGLRLVPKSSLLSFVKHELKGVLKYIGVKTCTLPDRDRHLSNAPSHTVTDIAAKSNSTVRIL